MREVSTLFFLAVISLQCAPAKAGTPVKLSDSCQRQVDQIEERKRVERVAGTVGWSLIVLAPGGSAPGAITRFTLGFATAGISQSAGRYHLGHARTENPLPRSANSAYASSLGAKAVAMKLG